MLKKTILLFLTLLIFSFVMAPLAYARVNDYDDYLQRTSAYMQIPEPPETYDVVNIVFHNPTWYVNSDLSNLDYVPTVTEQTLNTYMMTVLFPSGFQDYYQAGNCDAWFDMRHIPSTANNDRIGIYLNILLAQDYANMPIYILRYNGYGYLQSMRTLTINSQGNLRDWMQTPIKSNQKLWVKGFLQFRYDDTIVPNPQGGNFSPVSVDYGPVYFQGDYTYSSYLNQIAQDLYTFYNTQTAYDRDFMYLLQWINASLNRIEDKLDDFGLSPDVESALPSADPEVDTEVDEAHSREEELLSNQDDVLSDIDVIAQQVDDFALGDFRGGSDAINHIYNLFIQSNWVPSIAVLLSLFFGLAILILGRSIK